MGEYFEEKDTILHIANDVNLHESGKYRDLVFDWIKSNKIGLQSIQSNLYLELCEANLYLEKCEELRNKVTL